jgi:hypothetical protein
MKYSIMQYARTTPVLASAVGHFFAITVAARWNASF